MAPGGNKKFARAEVEGWNVEQVVSWAKVLVGDHANTLRKEEVNGRALLRLTEDKLTRHPYNLLGGPASVLEEGIQQWVPAAAQSSKQTSYFEEFLNNLHGIDKDDIFFRAVKYFPARIPVVNNEALAKQLVSDVNSIPHASTANLLLEDLNIIVNGPLCPNLPTKTALLYGFRNTANGLSSHVIKIPGNTKIVDQEFSISELLRNSEEPQRFVPLEKITIRAGSHMIDQGGTPLQVRNALLMPVYPATLQHPPTIRSDMLLKIGRYIKESVDIMHGLGIIHGDLKPANLFLSGVGNVVIGDYGAAGMKNTQLRETSQPYLATEILYSPTGSTLTPQMDYCMLAASLLEKHEPWIRTSCSFLDLQARTAQINSEELRLFIFQLLEAAAAV